MSSLLKLRRGSTVAHETFTGAEGEVTFNTDTNALVTHDGATAGGFEHTTAVVLAASTGSSLVGHIASGSGAVATTVQTVLRETVSATRFGADPTGVASSSAAVAAAQTYLASIGGGTLYFPPGEYKITTPIVMQPGITYKGAMKAGLGAYNPNRSRIFSTTGHIFTNSASTITEVCFRDLFIESATGGGHIFDWSAAGIVAKIEMSGVCLAQRNASKIIIYGAAAGGVFSLWLHDFEFVYVPACTYPPIWIASPTVNSIVIDKFWSTSNGESAAGNPAIWIESTNPGGPAFNVRITNGVFELPGSGSVVLKSVANSSIEDCTVYDLTIVPGYYQFAILKGATGPASNNSSIKRCRSTVGTVGVPDLLIDMSVAGQDQFILEGCTFGFAEGTSSAAGAKVLLINSSLGTKTNFPCLELGGGPTTQLKWSATVGTSANAAIWNGYPGNRDGKLNFTIDGVHCGDISKAGVFSWGAAHITQGGIMQAGSYVYPGTPAGAQQVAAGLLAGSGAPSGGNDGDFYFRGDGGAGTSIYMRRAGVWVGIV